MTQSPLETFLNHLDPTLREHQLAFFKVLAAAGPDAVEELAGRVHRASCSVGLRQLTLEFGFYFPWPELSPVIERLIRYEKNLELFETGARTLGKIRTPESLDSLRTLSLSRATPGFREVVAQVLLESDPAEAFQHHFSRLLEGSARPAEANEGAHQLARLLRPESLEPLRGALSHPDPLVNRHALRLICQIPSEEAASFPLGYLEELQQDAREDHEARTLLTAFRVLPRPEVQAKALQALSARWQERQPEAMADLDSGQAQRIQGAAETLRSSGATALDTLLLDALLAALDENPTRLARFFTQAGDLAHQRSRRRDFALQVSAQGLADMADRGHIQAERLLPALAEPLRQNTGNAGVATALARLVPAGAQDLVDLLLDQPEEAMRSAALEVLGNRRDPALRAALLKLRRDAISDIADRSLWHLGHLPDPVGTAKTLLDHQDPGEVLVGLRFIAIHKLEDLVPRLLELAERESRETVLIAIFETLGQVGSPRAVEPLLGFLRTCLRPRVQLALAEALRDLGDEAGALGLSEKAQEQKLPELCTVAVEALARAHGTWDRPLPGTAAPSLLAVTRGGWSARNPWPYRQRIADALLALHVQDQALWTGLSNLLQATLDEKRSPGALSTEELAHLQACNRALAQKARG